MSQNPETPENPVGPASPVVIQVESVHKTFGDLHVLKGCDLTVRSGEVAVLVGPSGSGKSTLLRCINQLEEPTAGRVLVDGVVQGYRAEPLPDGRWQKLRPAEIAAQRSRIGMVFQRFHLFPHLTALANVMEAPVQVRGLPRAAAEAKARELLERVGLGDRADHYPSELSGGQQQRVAIARALAMDPEILLLDEVTSALDPELVGEVLAVLKDIAAETDISMLIVTHEMQFARDVSDRVMMFDQGSIVEEGPPEKIFSDPAHQRTRDFLRAVL